MGLLGNCDTEYEKGKEKKSAIQERLQWYMYRCEISDIGN